MVAVQFDPILPSWKTHADFPVAWQQICLKHSQGLKLATFDRQHIFECIVYFHRIYIVTVFGINILLFISIKGKARIQAHP